MDRFEDQADIVDLGAVTTETKGPPVKHSDGIGGLNDNGLSND